MDYLNKDEPTEMKREFVIELIDKFFDHFTPLQREAINFQVIFYRNIIYLLNYFLYILKIIVHQLGLTSRWFHQSKVDCKRYWRFLN